MDDEQNHYDPSHTDPQRSQPVGGEAISAIAYLPISKALVVLKDSNKTLKPIISPLSPNYLYSAGIDITSLPPDTRICRQIMEICLYSKNFTNPDKLSVVLRSNLLSDLAPSLAEFCDLFGKDNPPHGPLSYHELLIDDILPVDKESSISTQPERNILLLRLGHIAKKSPWESRTALYKLDCDAGKIFKHKKNTDYDPRILKNWTDFAQITPFKK